MLPIVSIIIATRNEEDTIIKCIKSIMQQKYSSEKMEIIIADGLSNDNTVKMINEVSRQYKVPVKILKNEKVIQSSAWNLGIKESSGDIILIVSAHSFIQKDYIQECVHYLQKTGASNVGGPMLADGKGYIGKIIEFVHHSFFGLGGGRFHDKNFKGYVDTVYLGAWPKEVFNEIGLFDERLVRNQDIEFNARLRQNNGQVYLSPDIRSYYHCRDTLKGLWNQNFKNGKWVIYTKKIAPFCFSWRHFIPLVFVGTLIVSGILSLIGRSFGLDTFALLSFLVFVSIIFGYTLVTLFFSFQISFEKGFKYLAILPIVFSTLHFSYGLGSIFGVITMPKWYYQNKDKPHWEVNSSGDLINKFKQ